jgi:archaellin
LKVIPSPTPTLDPNITPSPTPEETPSLEVSYKVGDAESATKDIWASIRVKNTGKKPVDLAKVKVRYWYTKDSATSQEFMCDYAHMGEELVTSKFVDLETPVENADNYLEIGFTDDAGILGPGANTGEIQFRIIKGDFEAYDSSNDYSYMPDAKEFTENPCMTAYVNSVLAYGIPPVEEETPDIVYGDLNGDNEVNSTDLTLLKRRILRKIDKFDVPDTHGDLNIDGSIDSFDLTIMKRYILRKITKLPIITD